MNVLKKTYLIALLFTLTSPILFTGCKNEIEEPIPEPEIIPPTIKRIKTNTHSFEFFYDTSLSRIIKVDITYAYDNGDGIKSRPEATYTFEYDENNRVIRAFADRVVNQVTLINSDAHYNFSYDGGNISSIETDWVYPLALSGVTTYAYDLSGYLVKVENERSAHEFTYVNHVIVNSKEKTSEYNFTYKFSKYKNPANSLNKGIAFLVLGDYLYDKIIGPALTLQENYPLSTDHNSDYRNDTQFYILESKKGYPTKVQTKTQFYSQNTSKVINFEYVDL